MRDGLTEAEWKVLKTPLSAAQGNPVLQREIMQIDDKRRAYIRAEDARWVKPKTAKPFIGMVIRDDLGTQGIRNHADGKMYDSKSEFRKATRRAGCYEVGTDVKSDDAKWKPPIERGMRGDYNVGPALREALQKHGVK